MLSSEAWYKYAIDQSGIVAITDAKGVITYVNENFEKISGYTKEELIGKTHRLVKSDAHDEAFFNDMWQTISSGNIWRGEVCNRSKSGNLYWVSTTIIPHLDASGRPQSYMAIRFDITKEKELALQNELTTNFINKIIKTMPNMVFVMDIKSKKLTYYGGRILSILGYSADEFQEITEENILSLVHPDDLHKVEKNLINVNYLADNEVMSMINRMRHKNGSYRIIEKYITVFERSSDSSVKSIICLGKDITAKREAEILIEAQKARMMDSSKMAALGEMASNIAHEINNPLAIILGKANTVRDRLQHIKIVDEKANLALDKIEATVLRITNIIKGLKMFSRAADGDEFHNESLREIITNTLDLCTEKLKSNGVDLRITQIPDIKIRCKATQISQVLLNLINNSYDAIEKLPTKFISLEFKLEESMLNIFVTDSGPGIPSELVDKIMEPFFTTKEVGKGTGLGLSISSGIMQNHGGALRYLKESSNTCFHLTLPIRKEKI